MNKQEPVQLLHC